MNPVIRSIVTGVAGLLMAADLLAAPRPASLPPAVLPLGVGVNIHFTRGHEEDLDLIAAGGFKFIRMDLAWAATERKRGEYDWSSYDELTANLEKRGLRAIYILDYSNALYEDTVVSRNPRTGKEQRETMSPRRAESVAAFARWAAAAVGRYRGRGIVWEIWNEPNGVFWKPKPDVEQYIPLARATCKAVRAVDPEAVVLAPASSGFTWPFLEALLRSDVLACLSAVSVHPYRSYSSGPETVTADYRRLRDLIRRYAPPAKQGLPIVSGEWGYATHARGGVSPETQAAYFARQQLINLYQGVPISIWYDWKNDGPDPDEKEHNFGTVNFDLSPKPAYRAAQTLARELGGFRIERRIGTGRAEDYVLLLVNEAGQHKLAAWTTGDPHEVALALTIGKPGAVSAVTVQGAPAKVRVTPARLSMRIDASPVYVTFGQSVLSPSPTAPARAAARSSATSGR